MTLNNWDVDPGAARGIINTTRTHAESFTAKEDALQGAVEDAATASDSSLITGALKGTYENYLAKVAAVAGLTALNVANEGDKLVNAFVDADKIMADSARSNMDDVPSSPEEAR